MYEEIKMKYSKEHNWKPMKMENSYNDLLGLNFKT